MTKYKIISLKARGSTIIDTGDYSLRFHIPIEMISPAKDCSYDMVVYLDTDDWAYRFSEKMDWFEIYSTKED